jgi:hypothetical protein
VHGDGAVRVAGEEAVGAAWREVGEERSDSDGGIKLEQCVATVEKTKTRQRESPTTKYLVSPSASLYSSTACALAMLSLTSLLIQVY